jgi:predicted alpha/beta superfamily hydrolase
MSKLRDLVLLLALSWSVSSCTDQPAGVIYFELDLRAPIQEGWLDPGSALVGLRGDRAPLSWSSTNVATDDDGDGIYSLTLPISISGDSVTLQYKIKVDGIDNPDDGWQEGDNHRVTAYPGRQVRVTVSWTDHAVSPSTITGNVEIIRDFAFADLASRDIYVYLPPGYDDSDRRYPVLYMHDGRNVFDAAAIGDEWRVDEWAEALISDGEIEPLIIVGVASTADRMDEYTPTRQIWEKNLARTGPPTGSGPLRHLTGEFSMAPGETVRVTDSGDTLLVQIPGSDSWDRAIPTSDTSFYLPRANITVQAERTHGAPVPRVIATKPPQGGSGDLYGEALVRQLKPYIDDRFRTRPGREWTGLGGSSLGGLITLHLGLVRYPEIFGRLLVASPSVWWDDRWILGALRDAPVSSRQPMWVDVGSAEPEGTVTNARALKDVLVERGWGDPLLRYVEARGAVHNEGAWAERVPDMLRYLYPAAVR